jgi:uncharacterized YccA/Bax inhibitor family protein
MHSKGMLLQAVLPTILVFVIMLIIYKFRIIKVDNKVVKWNTLFGEGLALLYLTDLLLMPFGLELLFLHIDRWGGFFVSLTIIAVVSSFLLSYFYFIEEAAHRQAPKYMEWYLFFGVFLTIVWLYIGIIILMLKPRKKGKVGHDLKSPTFCILFNT